MAGDTGQEECSELVLLSPDGILIGDSNDREPPVFCSLRHPRINESAVYLINDTKSSVFEVNVFTDAYRSWFVDETVKKDGSLHILTPVNPLFLCLPYLAKTAKMNKFMTLDHILEDSDFPESARLSSIVSHDGLCRVCDIKDIGDDYVYKMNQEKAFAWLKVKTERVCDSLKVQDMEMVEAPGVEGFMKHEQKHETFFRYAFDIVCDYLPADLEKDFKSFLGIKDPVPVLHEKPSLEEPNSKRAKTSTEGPVEDYSKDYNKGKKEKDAPKLNAAQKRLAKVDKTGMKSISNFFTAKPAKK